VNCGLQSAAALPEITNLSNNTSTPRARASATLSVAYFRTRSSHSSSRDLAEAIRNKISGVT